MSDDLRSWAPLPRALPRPSCSLEPLRSIGALNRGVWQELVIDRVEVHRNAVKEEQDGARSHQVADYAIGPWSDALQEARITTELCFPVPDDDRLRRLVRDPEFREVVVGRWAGFPELFRQAVTVQGTLEQIRGLIERELSGVAGGG